MAAEVERSGPLALVGGDVGDEGVVRHSPDGEEEVEEPEVEGGEDRAEAQGEARPEHEGQAPAKAGRLRQVRKARLVRPRGAC